MLIGRALKPTSTIGVIAPASPENKLIIEKKIAEFRSLGFNLKVSTHIYDRYGHLAGHDKERANDLLHMFEDSSIDGIVCFRGGYGTSRIIPFLDKKIIKRNPKFFCGYSDITLLLNYFAKLGLITFHGPMINSDFNNNATLSSFLDISSYNKAGYTYNFLDYHDNINFINPKSFSGKIQGGNLSMICSSIGTSYEVNTDNSILLIEDVNEAPYAIDRMITQLINSKKLTKCKGIIIGHMTDCDLANYDRSLTTQEVLIDRLSNLNIPTIIGIPFGHDYPNFTIPIGCNARFSYSNMTLTILDKFLI